MRNRELAALVRVASETPWAMLPAKLEEIRAVLYARLNSEESIDKLSAEYRAKIVGPNDVPRAQQVGSVAVIPVFGTIGYRMNMLSDFSGGTSTEQLKAQIVKAANDNDVTSILLDVNSPGGSVGGLPELHAAIMDARVVKPVVASVNSMSASAAYWITSAASEIVSTPSGEAGSIGVFYMHEDLSKMAETEGVNVTFIQAGKYKTEANQFQPLSEDAAANIQDKVNAYYEMFVNAIAAGRGMTAKDVKSNFGEGRMMIAQKAKSVGMIDKIEPIDATISRLSRPGAKVKSARVEDLGRRLDLGAKMFGSK